MNKATVFKETCPYCKRELNEPDVQPNPGDLFVCAGCMGVLCFDHDLSIIVPDDFQQN